MQPGRLKPAVKFLLKSGMLLTARELSVAMDPIKFAGDDLVTVPKEEDLVISKISYK